MQEAGLHRPSFKAASKLNDGQTGPGIDVCTVGETTGLQSGCSGTHKGPDGKAKPSYVRRRCSGVFDAAQLHFTWTQAIDGTKQH